MNLKNAVKQFLPNLNLVCALCVAPALPSGALAAAFTPGNIVVYRAGDGAAANLAGTGNPVFLDEYTPAGSLVQSIAMPTAAGGGQNQLIAAGTSTSEGLMTRSTDGRYLVLMGHAANPGGIVSTTPKTVGRVDANVNIDTSTALTDMGSSAAPRGAASANGSVFWVSGSVAGSRYVPTLGASTSVQLSTTVVNLRATAIFGGQLYVSDSSGTTVRLGAVGSGTPTTSGQTIVNLPGFPTSTGSPYAFFFADLDAGVAGFDTLYVADDTANQIQKYSLVSGSWTLKGTISATAVRGLTATVSGTSVTLYGTTGGSATSGGGSIYNVTDTAGYNAAPSTSGASTIATAAANTAFRGIALAPVAALSVSCPPDPAPQCASAVPTAAGTSAEFTTQNGSISGGCSPYTVTSSDSTAAGSCANKKTITRHYTITDSCGSTKTCDQTITVNDNTAPVVSCPPRQSIVAPDFSGAPATYPAATATDNCDGSLTPTCNPPSGSHFDIGTTPVNCTATDSCGNIGTCSSFFDVFPPPINSDSPNQPAHGIYGSPPGFKTTYNGLFVIVISNICHGGFTPQQPPPLLTDGPQTNTFSSVLKVDVSQDNGQHFQTTFLNGPTKVRLVHTSDDPDGTQHYDTEMLSMDLSGGPSIMIRESPTLASTGKTTIRSLGNGTWAIDSFFDVFTELSTDSGGSWTPAAGAVPVGLAPTVCLALTCPAYTNVECGADTSPAATGTATASSVCGPVAVTFNDSVTGTSCSNIILRTWTATDRWGSTSNCTQCITNVDTKPPVLTVDCNALQPCHQTLTAAIADVVANSTAHDACCPDNSLTVTAQKTGGTDCDPEITVTATDCCNNSTTKKCTPHVDGTAPTFDNCVSGDTDLGCNPPAASFACDPNVTASDNCGSATVTCVASAIVSSGTGNCHKSRTLTYTATDGCGNTATCVRNLTWIRDVTPPTFDNCTSGTTSLGCNPTTPIPDCDPNVTASDDCGTATVGCVKDDSVTGCVHTRTLTYTATDGCGNKATCVRTFTWTEDTVKPTIHCPGDITTNGAVVTYTVTANDACDPNPTIVCDHPSGSTFPVGMTTVSCCATDTCGNFACCEFKVTVINKSTAVFVDAAYAGKPCGTMVNFPDNGQPGPHTVCVDAFGTMQAGVDATAPRGTNRVAAGTYHELVHVNSPMTILGPNAGIDPRSTCPGGAARGPEAVIDGTYQETAIEFDSSGITLDGFTVANGTTDAAHSGIDLHNQWDDNKILNNIITNNTIGIFGNCTGPLPTIIQKNLIIANNLACTNVGGCAVEGAGIYVDASVNLQILDNEFSGHSVGNPILAGATGPGSNAGLKIDRNHFHANINASAVYVLGISAGTVSGNRIVAAPDVTCLSFSGGNNGVQVANNFFSGGERGVRVENAGYGVQYPGLETNSDLHINGNSFVGFSFVVSTDYAVGNESGYTGPLDASANWWGANTEVPGVTGVIDTTGGSVDYTPWLNTGIEPVADVCDGFQGDFSILWVSAFSDQTGGNSAIQEGVDRASSGGTVKIIGGTYPGNVDATGNTVTLSPGTSPARVRINGDFKLGSTDTLVFELGGNDPGTDYDQFVVNGTVTLGGATLSASSSFTYAACAQVTLIVNDLSDPVTGTFSGLPNGSIVTIGGQNFRIRYDRGPLGNDVVLILDTTSPTFDNCPADQDLGCNPSSVPGCDPGVTASDNCDGAGNATVTCSFSDTPNPPGTCEHTRTNTYVATDNAGNTNVCTQLITWKTDTTPPTITVCPLGTDLGCNPTVANQPTCASVQAGVTATDNCGPTTLSCVQADSDAGCVHTRKFTITAKDQCLNSSAPCVVTYTWTVDTTQPVITCPPDAFVECGQSSGVATATDACDPNPTITFVDNPVFTNCTGQAKVIRTWKATDHCNNMATCNQTITYVDGTPPVITCPPDKQLQCGASTATNNTGVATATDNCPAPVAITFTDAATAANCTGQPGIDRTWKATDNCGNSTNCVQHITFVDTTPPVVTCPPDKQLQCGASTLTNNTGVATATDNCNQPVLITFQDTSTPANCTGHAGIDRTWTATDSCGNSTNCVQHITFVDTTPPVITGCPANTVNLQCNPTRPTCTSAQASLTITDNCGAPVVNCVPGAVVTNVCQRTQTFTITATDGCTNSSNCQITYTWSEDTTPPTFFPQPFVCDSTNFLVCNVDELTIPHCLANIGASDNCSTPTVVCSQVQTTNLCAGSTTDGTRTRVVTYTAYDACGNTNICRSTYIWTVDKTKPVLSGCPATTLNAGCNPASLPTTNSYNVTATDCSATTITKSQVDATNGCTRTRTITYTATDCGGNSSSCSQVVSWREDTSAPTLVGCPSPSINMGCNPSSIPTCATYNVTATDDCGATVSCTSSTVTNGCVRTRTLVYTATDACSNSASCQQVITWTVDTTGPVFTGCPAPTLDAGCNPNPASLPTCASYNVTASDTCSGSATVTCASVDATNGCVRTRTITYTAVDGCNNTNTCSQVVSWRVDASAPFFTLSPTNRHLSCNPATIPDCDTSPANIVATDNCGVTNIACSRSDSVSPDGCFHDRTITYTAFDACGNASTNAVQHITWTTDTTPPTFVVCPANTNLGVNPSSIPDCDLSPGHVVAEDGCSTPIVSCFKMDATNGCTRTRTLVYTATDACNNVAFCNQVITYTVTDNPPVLTIVLQGNNVVVSWPITCVNFRLQQSASLNPTTWSNVAQPVVVTNNMNTVTIPISGASTFYRLIYP